MVKIMHRRANGNSIATDLKPKDMQLYIEWLLKSYSMAPAAEGAAYAELMADEDKWPTLALMVRLNDDPVFHDICRLVSKTSPEQWRALRDALHVFVVGRPRESEYE